MAVSLGVDFLLAVDSNGIVVTCGQNKYGQLGLGRRPALHLQVTQRAMPGSIDLNSVANQGTAIMVSAGLVHAACVTRNGSVYTWGRGSRGQLGVAPVGSQPTPQHAYSAFMGQSPAIMVACGHDHTLLLTAAGHMWGCGHNSYFQVGVQSMTNPDEINNSDISVFTMMPHARFDNGDGRTEIGFIAAGSQHSVAVGKHNGVLWTWGRDRHGTQLGHGNGQLDYCVQVPTALPRTTFGEDVVSAAAMSTSTMAVTASGVLWATGVSMYFALGLGALFQCHRFSRVGGHEHFGAGGVRSVACSISHTLIVAQDGSLWVCGNRESNCLGHYPMPYSFHVPVRIDPTCFHHEAIVVASTHLSRCVAVSASGGIYTWGSEPSGMYTGLCSAVATAHDLLPNIAYVPQRVAHIDSVGLWNYPLTEEEFLAFLMCTHLRLGARSLYSALPIEMLQSIRTSLAVPTATHMGRGLRNLLGI